MPVLFITFGLSLALGVIRLLLRGMGSCLALIVHPVRLVVRVLALAAQTLMVMLLLLVIAFLLMHFFAGSDAPALDGSFWTIVGVFAASLLATGVLGSPTKGLRNARGADPGHVSPTAAPGPVCRPREMIHTDGRPSVYSACTTSPVSPASPASSASADPSSGVSRSLASSSNAASASPVSEPSSPEGMRLPLSASDSLSDCR